jgi:hypothetical protein
MSRRVTYYNSSYASILNPSQIFGANLYDWWDFTDLATQSIAGGGAINSITSKGTNAAVFSSSGTSRPESIVGINGLNVADFDGVNDFMQVATSTAMYNFLHNGSLGTVILINRIEDANSDNQQVILNNDAFSAANVGYGISFDDRSSVSRNKTILSRASNSSGGVSFLNLSANGYYSEQQYNLLINKVDANASPVADRSAISTNGGSEIKNNVSTVAPSVANASFNMTIGRNAGLTFAYLKGQIPEVIILTSHPTPTQITQLNNYYTNKYGGTFPIV